MEVDIERVGLLAHEIADLCAPLFLIHNPKRAEIDLVFVALSHAFSWAGCRDENL